MLLPSHQQRRTEHTSNQTYKRILLISTPPAD
jgi:hypothetical protein